MSDKVFRDLEHQIQQLRELSYNGLDLSKEIAQLEAKLATLKAQTETPPALAQLDEWERVKLARHPKRPYALDYIKLLMDDFYELHGDRLYGDDWAVIAGLAQFEGETLVVIGTQKGRDAAENVQRNFGMPHPEGYRKAMRAMKLGERFGFPIVSLIDTPGAYPGVGAEERNVGGALAHNIYEMFKLRVPIIVAIIGEGGSGGAMALGVGDRVLMFENATYSVITPEGCAAILFRDASKAPEAARALKLTAASLLELGVVDEIIAEPEGAHLDPAASAQMLKRALRRHLDELKNLPLEHVIEQRAQKFQAMGIYEEVFETT